MYQVGIEQHLVEKGEKCYKVSQGYLEEEVLKAGREARKVMGKGWCPQHRRYKSCP